MTKYTYIYKQFNATDSLDCINFQSALDLAYCDSDSGSALDRLAGNARIPLCIKNSHGRAVWEAPLEWRAR